MWSQCSGGSRCRRRCACSSRPAHAAWTWSSDIALRQSGSPRHGNLEGERTSEDGRRGERRGKGEREGDGKRGQREGEERRKERSLDGELENENSTGIKKISRTKLVVVFVFL